MGILGATASYLAFSVVHFVLFVLSITVCGLYGVDLHRAAKAHVGADGRWVYAEIVGGLSAFTTLLYFVPFILRFAVVWMWNLVMFILWITLMGIFGKLYIHEMAEGNKGIQRMKNAVWVDLACALLWLSLTVGAFGYWWHHRERHSRFTGRARV